MQRGPRITSIGTVSRDTTTFKIFDGWKLGLTAWLPLNISLLISTSARHLTIWLHLTPAHVGMPPLILYPRLHVCHEPYFTKHTCSIHVKHTCLWFQHALSHLLYRAWPSRYHRSHYSEVTLISSSEPWQSSPELNFYAFHSAIAIVTSIYTWYTFVHVYVCWWILHDNHYLYIVKHLTCSLY